MKEFPFVSVILPIRNEAAYIDSCLSAIVKQDYPPERMEILIADGLSEDDTVRRIEKYTSSPYSISILKNPRKIFPTGFNIALQKARGDIVIMLGGHTQISSNYISQCVKTLSSEKVECVGGKVETVSEKPVGKAIAVAMSSKFGVGDVMFRVHDQKKRLVDTAAFGAYFHSAIVRCGLLDEEMVRNQDDEYNYRLRELGGKILFEPTISVKYYSRQTLMNLWRQYFQYGFWKVRVLQKHPRQMRPRQFVPPAFVAAILASILFFFISQFSNFNLQFLFFLVTGSYILANFTASVLTAAKKGWRYMTLLPLVFAILHISYGLGFLAGLVRFWNRWGDKVGKVPAWSHSAGPLPSDR